MSPVSGVLWRIHFRGRTALPPGRLQARLWGEATLGGQGSKYCHSTHPQGHLLYWPHPLTALPAQPRGAADLSFLRLCHSNTWKKVLGPLKLLVSIPADNGGRDLTG